MPKPDYLGELGLRLAELDCPRGPLRRLVQEVADHREDLKQAALQEGLSGPEAEARANVYLGDPAALAGRLMAVQRQSTWWGRHSLISFCLLPLVAVPVLWVLVLTLELALEFALGYGWNGNQLHVAASNPAAFHRMAMAVQGADLASMTVVALCFCWLARRSAVSLRWMAAACGICSLYALFIYVQIEPHHFTLGASWTSPWTALLGSLHWGERPSRS